MTSTSPLPRLVLYVASLALLLAMYQRLDHWSASRAAAAEPPVAAKTDDAAKKAEQLIAEGEKEKQAEPEAKPAAPEAAPAPTVWELFQKGGVLMYPISLLSVVVVAFTLERFIGLRRSAVVPRSLVRSLRKYAGQPNGLDPRPAYELCNKYPSTAGTVIKAMLNKFGRGEQEVDAAVTTAGEREASRLYMNVRWLNMAMSVAPMLGLLGTVQGMIIVFMGASHLPVGANKAEYMAEGIYLKLVCTFAGLIVAIPSAVLSYWFESRIQKLLGEVEDLVLEIQPRMHKYEKYRRSRNESSEKPKLS